MSPDSLGTVASHSFGGYSSGTPLAWSGAPCTGRCADNDNHDDTDSDKE